MSRLAGYQIFCWLALAFMTLGATASRTSFVAIGSGLALTAAGAIRERRRRIRAR